MCGRGFASLALFPLRSNRAFPTDFPRGRFSASGGRRPLHWDIAPAGRGGPMARVGGVASCVKEPIRFFAHSPQSRRPNCVWPFFPVLACVSPSLGEICYTLSRRLRRRKPHLRSYRLRTGLWPTPDRIIFSVRSLHMSYRIPGSFQMSECVFAIDASFWARLSRSIQIGLPGLR